MTQGTAHGTRMTKTRKRSGLLSGRLWDQYVVPSPRRRRQQLSL